MRVRVAGTSGAVGVALFGALAALALAGVAAAGEVSLEERLAAASPERPQEVFLVCRASHTIDKGAAHTIGPNLWAVVGRPVASTEGYDRYTPAMSSFGGVWSPERLSLHPLRDRPAQLPQTVRASTSRSCGRAT